MIDPTYVMDDIKANLAWDLAFVISEIINDNAPIGWSKNIFLAEILLYSFDIKRKDSGTNSTMLTECCDVAICDDEAKCPSCGRNVIGWDSPQEARRKIRWRNATQHWKR